MSNEQKSVVENPWRRLREFTDARIGLGRAGISLPTKELLAFQLAHARARDAVHLPLDPDATSEALARLELEWATTPICLHSRAEDRMTYLQRPDLGRRLNDESRELLKAQHGQLAAEYDLAIVVADGLSSCAVTENLVPFLQALNEKLSTDSASDWRIAPITLVTQGRVAVGDEVGELLNARCVMLLVGERPGLSSPDSLGLYLTWNPSVGLTDASRNCISNIRPAGLSYSEAARRAFYLLSEAKRLKLSGVNLKDRTQDDVVETIASSKNFLIS